MSLSLPPELWSNALSDEYTRAKIYKHITEHGMNAVQEAKPAGPINTTHFTVDAIENGYIITYRCSGMAEKRRYAKDLLDMAEQITAAAVEMKLRGAA